MNIQQLLRHARETGTSAAERNGRDLPFEASLPSFDGATAWLNSPPLSPANLRGKVVLVQFWTYTCINWLRTLPYIRAWAELYQEQGLVVIGAHTPEFPFEHELDNVRRAAADLHVAYPIAQDNDYAIWQAFANQYWPALYLADARGHLRYHTFGEGQYEETEQAIRQLLAEAGRGVTRKGLVTVEGSGIEAAADWDSVRSPETYLGYSRADDFASPGGAVTNRRHVYTLPARLRRNQWALAGEWTVGAQAASLQANGGQIACRFEARDLHLVMGPTTPGMPVRFRVRLDGRPPGPAHGLDVDAEGNGTVREPRLYQLIRQPGPIAERQFEITFLDAGVGAYAFTFG
jgi:thiol-disulfide isomerase/thioredoxin